MTHFAMSRRAAALQIGALVVAASGCARATPSTEIHMLIDDFADGDLTTRLGTAWEGITDGVMGGLSQMTLMPEVRDGRPCAVMRGDVSLENNGGFVQMATDLSPDGSPVDASGFAALELDVHGALSGKGSGKTEQYSVHLRTADVRRPWQSYRAQFDAPPHWRTIRLLLTEFTPHRLEAPFDTTTVRRLGIVAIGRAFKADLAVARVALVNRTERGV